MQRIIRTKRLNRKKEKKDVKSQGITAGTYNPTADLAAKFAPKPGSRPCSVCLVTNDVSTTVCVACGAPKL